MTTKAYDWVEWVLLRKVMAKLRFEGGRIEKIMNYVSSVTFSVLINGHK